MINQSKKVFVDTIYQVAGKVIISFLGFITTAFLTRYLGVTQFGEYNLITTIAGFITLFADFGLATYVIREIASERENKDFIKHIFSLRFYIALLSLLIVCVALLFLPYSSTVKLGIFISSVSGFLLLLSSVFWAFHQGKLNFKKVVAIQIIAGVTGFILTLIFIFFKFSLLWIISINLFSNAAGLLLSLGDFRKSSLLTNNISAYKKILYEVWPFGVGLILSIAYFKIDTIMLSFYFNPSLHPDVAYYSIAYKIFEVLLVFAGYFTSTLFPIFSQPREKNEFKKIYEKYFLFTLLLALGGGIGMFLFAPLLIQILGGNSYLSAVPSVQILSLSLFASILSGFFLNIAIVGNKQLFLIKFAILAMILNIALNLFIMPKYSFVGASITTVLTQLFILITNIMATIVVFREKHAKIRG
jgi:O-antigen/teichoic acid export membrane protein